MARNRRTLIALGIIILVLVALFVTGVLCGPGDGGAGSGCSADERERLRVRLFHAKPVTSDQLTGCTQSLGSFRITQACTLTIAPARTRSRKLVISAFDAEIELTMIVDADHRKITQRAKLEPGESEELFVGKDGQSITVNCVAHVVCTAVVSSDSAR